MKTRQLFLLLAICLQGTIVASAASPARRPLAPVLERKYEEMVGLINRTPIVDGILRKNVSDLATRLRGAGGEQQALDLIRRLAMHEEKASAAAQGGQSDAEPEIGSIPMPIAAFAPGQKEIKLAEKEPISNQTYGDLLREQIGHGNPMILARVETSSPNGMIHVHYYDAYLFNVWRFGKNYPLAGNLRVEKKTAPLNNMRIRAGNIQYFTYDPQQPGQGFQYGFSEANFIDNPRMRLLIDKHQNIDAARKREARERDAGEWVPAPLPQVEEQLLPQALTPNALMNRGYAYYAGDGVEKNYAEAVRYLIPAANQGVEPIEQSTAQRILGEIYHIGGHGIEQNFATALTYLVPAANQGVEPFERAAAQRVLGETYLLGGHGVEQNFATARTYLVQATNQDVNPIDRAAAQSILGQIYSFGDHGVERNYATALTYLEPAANQNVAPIPRAAAQRALGEIYSLGGHGVAPNFATALTYLEPVADAANQDASPIDRAVAQRRLGEIYVVGDHSIKPNFATARAYLVPAANQDVAPLEQAIAQRRLGEIYSLGGYGVEQNFATALTYLMPAANQNVTLLEQAVAQKLIGEIYLFGGHGVERNYAMARTYLTPAADQDVSPRARDIAQRRLRELDVIEALENAGL